jgi:chaperonin GroES
MKKAKKERQEETPRGKQLELKIKPLGDRALIRELDNKDRERTTDSGIIIPETVSEDKGAKRGQVVAAGEGRYDDGKLIPMKVKSGDTVLYQWGDTIKLEGKEYAIVSESNILAIIR